MSRRTEREIARRLARVPAETPAAEPPAGLLERLRADVPDDVGERLARGEREGEPGGGSVVPFPTRRWMAAAAMLVTLVGGGFLAWKLSQAVSPLDREVFDGAPATQAPAATEREGAWDEARELRVDAGVERGEEQPQELDRQAMRGRRQQIDEGEDLDQAAGEVSPQPRQEPRRLRLEVQAEDELAEETGVPAVPLPLAGTEEGSADLLMEDAAADQAVPFAEPEVAAPAPPAAAPAPLASSEQRARSAAPSAAAAAPAPRAPEARRRAAPSAVVDLVVRVVVDDEQRPGLPGATVELEGKGIRQVAVADAGGEARFPGLQPGTYRLRAYLDGFETMTGRIKLRAWQAAAVVELRLPVASFAEEIVVTGRSRWSLGRAKRVPASPPLAEAERRVQYAPPPPPPPPAPEPAKPAAEPGGPQMIGAEEDLQADQEMGLLREALPPVHPEVATSADRLSTFGLDVDTGSFTLLRAHLEAGQVPPPATVRVEEVVNAQRFSDPFAAAPAPPGEVFRLLADGAPSPFAPGPEYRLVRFRVAARDLAAAERKPVVLTLVVDVSGSMQGEKLDLVRRGLYQLADSLRPDDRVALVVFSDQARLTVPHGEPGTLRRGAAGLTTEGGTNAEAGLVLGYETARAAFVPGASNRVMLLSDGVANIGATGPEAMLARVAKEAAAGIELTTVGVGMGDFNDALLETLADRGDGRYAYVDDRREIERLFSGQLDGTLQTVAEEARAQVEFEPRVVESWRQLGYENRALADHEFRYESVDAGEIGPGHSVTALYEVKLRAEPPPGRPLALLKLRWREPAAAGGTPGAWHESEQRLLPRDLAPSWDAASPDLRLAAVAAELAEQLRRSPHAASPPAALLAAARRLAGHPELADLAERWSRLAPAPEAREQEATEPEPAAPTPRP